MGTSVWDSCDLDCKYVAQQLAHHVWAPSLALCRRLNTVLTVEQRAAVVSKSKFEREVLVDSHLLLASHCQCGRLIVEKDYEMTAKGRTRA